MKKPFVPLILVAVGCSSEVTKNQNRSTILKSACIPKGPVSGNDNDAVASPFSSHIGQSSVILSLRFSDGAQTQCLGALIGPKTVATAARCFDHTVELNRSASAVVFPPMGPPTGTPAPRLPIQSVFRHPRYQSTPGGYLLTTPPSATWNGNNDIALVVVNGSLPNGFAPSRIAIATGFSSNTPAAMAAFNHTSGYLSQGSVSKPLTLLGTFSAMSYPDRGVTENRALFFSLNRGVECSGADDTHAGSGNFVFDSQNTPYLLSITRGSDPAYMKPTLVSGRCFYQATDGILVAPYMPWFASVVSDTLSQPVALPPPSAIANPTPTGGSAAATAGGSGPGACE